MSSFRRDPLEGIQRGLGLALNLSGYAVPFLRNFVPAHPALVFCANNELPDFTPGVRVHVETTRPSDMLRQSTMAYK